MFLGIDLVLPPEVVLNLAPRWRLGVVETEAEPEPRVQSSVPVHSVVPATCGAGTDPAPVCVCVSEQTFQTVLHMFVCWLICLLDSSGSRGTEASNKHRPQRRKQTNGLELWVLYG